MLIYTLERRKEKRRERIWRNKRSGRGREEERA